MANKIDLDGLKEGDLVKITLHSLVKPTIIVYKKVVDGKPYHFIAQKQEKIIDYGSDLKCIKIINDGIIELDSAHISISTYMPPFKRYDEYKQLLINSKLWEEN